MARCKEAVCSTNEGGAKMNILQALGFMVLGGVIVEVFESHAWRRYQLGKREGRDTPRIGQR